jgi:hypothetical protein
LNRYWETRHHHGGHRLTRPEGPAEITRRRAYHPIRVAQRRGPVEPHIEPQCLALLRRRILSEHHDRRIAGEQVRERKHGYAHDQQYGKDLRQPTHDEAHHGSTRLRDDNGGNHWLGCSKMRFHRRARCSRISGCNRIVDRLMPPKGGFLIAQRTLGMRHRSGHRRRPCVSWPSDRAGRATGRGAGGDGGVPAEPGGHPADGRRGSELDRPGVDPPRALAADTSLSSQRVVRELDALVQRRGKPLMVVSDDGTELTTHAVRRWQQDTGVEWHYVAPGKPIDNAFAEAFNSRVRA